MLGYPLDGPFDAEPARVRDVRPIRGPDIYNDQTVTRDIYTIRGLVRSGNSGGPAGHADGSVLGVVFAAAADDPQTGFALTIDEATPVINEGVDATDQVHRLLYRLARRTPDRPPGRSRVCAVRRLTGPRPRVAGTRAGRGGRRRGG